MMCSSSIMIKRAESQEIVEQMLNLFDADYETPFSVYTQDLAGYSEKIFRYGEVYIALLGDVPVGMCAFYANDQSESKVAYLTAIVTSRKTRKLGVGKALLNKFLASSVLRSRNSSS